MITSESWPTDPVECHALLDHAQQAGSRSHSAGSGPPAPHSKNQPICTIRLCRRISSSFDELRQQIELYRRYVFGPRRERVIEAPGQGHLFELDTTESLPSLPEPPASNHAATPRPRPSRKLDYDQLPQVRIEHDVPEVDKLCTHCGEAKARIGEDEARVLEFIPARFELHIHVLPKYACSHCRDGVAAPEGSPASA